MNDSAEIRPAAPDHGVPRPGKLSPWFASRRRRRANSLLPDDVSGKAILDIGCGRYPAFLAQTGFSRKVGVDRSEQIAQAPADISIVQRELEDPEPLPFADGSFDAVTMMAVMEHLQPTRVPVLLRDIHRLLAPAGTLIITVPSTNGDRILHALSPTGLTSRENINEHKDRYTPRKLRALLIQAGFAPETVRTGHFMFGLNLWVRAIR